MVGLVLHHFGFVIGRDRKRASRRFYADLIAGQLVDRSEDGELLVVRGKSRRQDEEDEQDRLHEGTLSSLGNKLLDSLSQGAPTWGGQAGFVEFWLAVW